MILTEVDYEDHVSCGAGYCPACDDVTMRDGVALDEAEIECPDCGVKIVMGVAMALMAGHIEVGGEGG